MIGHFFLCGRDISIFVNGDDIPGHYFADKHLALPWLQILRSGFKTSPRAQSLCWTETVNPRKIPDIPVLGCPSPP
jgi:hypothetical protein